jgi:hypothetical protein
MTVGIFLHRISGQSDTIDVIDIEENQYNTLDEIWNTFDISSKIRIFNKTIKRMAF